MGRKGGGRKAFLKTAKPTEESTNEHQEGPRAEEKPSDARPIEDDPSSKFLHESAVPEEEVQRLVEADIAHNRAFESAEQNPAQKGQNGVSDETKGQLIQRHKKELKAHKEQMKKLGKKKKDEVEQLDKEIESRHNTELLAWEAHHKEEDLSSTSLVAPTIGLYDLKIGDSEEKQPKKPTKAQKRREQRAAEEADREARIAAEQAALGPDSNKQKEAAELDKVLRPLGLAVKEIPADGHCMYRAVQDQLQAGGDDPGLDYTELRQETASYMRAFPDAFLPFVSEEEVKGKDVAQQFEEYCDKVEETAAWGGQVELQALAQAIERHILVHCAGLPVVEQGAEYKGKHPPLQICYLRHAYTLGEHYNSVQAVES